MNKHEAIGYLPLVAALAEGKTLQLQRCDSSWRDIEEPLLNYPPERYRVKPELVLVHGRMALVVGFNGEQSLRMFACDAAGKTPLDVTELSEFICWVDATVITVRAGDDGKAILV
jgi:hypothetical protein